MSRFYTTDLAFMWMGYAGAQARAYNSVLIEFIFDIYNKTDVLRSYGVINRNFVLDGNYEPLFGVDNNRLGARFFSNSSVPLNDIDFRREQLNIQTIAFFMQFMYTEDLPDNFVLVTRGTPG